MVRTRLQLAFLIIYITTHSMAAAEEEIMERPRINLSTQSKMEKARLISFDTNTGKIDINLDLSVPFLSIPLDEKLDSNGLQMPLMNLNVKALTVFGILMAISTFILPLFVKNYPPMPPVGLFQQYGKEHKRSNRGFDASFFGDSLKDMFFKDTNMKPCIQLIACWTTATASQTKNPTSLDQIIDGLSRNKWVQQAINGTLINEAVAKGHQVLELDECSTTYNKCGVNQELLSNVLKLIGL